MQPTHSESLRAPNETQDTPAGSNGFDVRQRAYRRDIERQARDMALLVADLLDVSPIARGQMQLQREQLDANAV